MGNGSDDEKLYEVISVDDDLHVIPVEDLFAHVPVLQCPCNPYQQEQNRQDILLGVETKPVWIHRRIKDDENKH